MYGLPAQEQEGYISICNFKTDMIKKRVTYDRSD